MNIVKRVALRNGRDLLSNSHTEIRESDSGVEVWDYPIIGFDSNHHPLYGKEKKEKIQFVPWHMVELVIYRVGREDVPN